MQHGSISDVHKSDMPECRTLYARFVGPALTIAGAVLRKVCRWSGLALSLGSLLTLAPTLVMSWIDQNRLIGWPANWSLGLISWLSLAGLVGNLLLLVKPSASTITRHSGGAAMALGFALSALSVLGLPLLFAFNVLGSENLSPTASALIVWTGMIYAPLGNALALSAHFRREASQPVATLTAAQIASTNEVTP